MTTVAIDWEDPVKMCGLRADIWAEHCSGDGHHDTHVMTKPSPPPSAPRIPIPRMSPAERAAILNLRFRDARPSVDLQEVGIIAHQFDRLELRGSPWKSCNYHCDSELNGQSLTGRMSTFIMYGDMRKRSDRKAVPLVSNDGGLILRPSKVAIECAFGVDGATVGLSGGPNGDGCPWAWCDPSGRIEANGYCSFWGAPPNAAWKAENLDKLLELHQQFGEPYQEPGYHSGYNEAIVDGWSWNENLPNTIEAFFELEGSGVESTPDRGHAQASYARDAHSRFLLEYDLTEEEVPLLKFDPSRWDAPFRVGGPPPDPVATLNERFHDKPYGAWPDDSTLAFSGVLVHCIDGYESHDQPWLPEHPYMSSSLIFADQRVDDDPIPVFTCKDGGVIFRPGASTKLVCGNAADSGGACHAFCKPAPEVGDVASFSFPGDGCGSSWRPPDFGNYLARTAAWRKMNHRSNYNEIIVEGAGPQSQWSGHAASTIGAFFQIKGSALDVVRYHHANFLRAYNLDESTHPFVTLDPHNWDAPFAHAPAGA